MRRLLVFGGAFFLVSGVAGCKSDVHAKAANNTLTAVKDLNKILRKITSVDEKKKPEEQSELIAKNAKENKDQLKKAAAELVAAKQQADNLRANLTEEEREKLDRDYGAKLREEVAETLRLAEKLTKNEKAREYVRDALDELSKIQ